MAHDTECDIDPEIGLSFIKRCQAPDDDCDAAATCVVWCDHHKQGCAYTGYRCDIHRNLLALETRRMLEHLQRGGSAICSRCGEEITGTEMGDHLRWIAL